MQSVNGIAIFSFSGDNIIYWQNLNLDSLPVHQRVRVVCKTYLFKNVYQRV